MSKVLEPPEGEIRLRLRDKRAAIIRAWEESLAVGASADSLFDTLLEKFSPTDERVPIPAEERTGAPLKDDASALAITLRSIGDAVISTSAEPGSPIVFLNPIAEKLTGWSFAEARGQPVDRVFRIINEKTRAPAFNPIDAVLRAGKVQGLANHTVLVSRSGTEHVIEDSAAPILDDEGTVRGVVLVFRDTTESKKLQAQVRTAEDALRSERARAAEDQQAWLESVLEDLPTALVLLDPRDARITFSNRTARELFRMPLTNTRPTDRIGPGKLQVFDVEGNLMAPEAAPSARAARGESFHDFEYRIGVEGEIREFVASAHTLPAAHGHERSAILLLSDITERVRIRNALERSESRLKATIGKAAVGFLLSDSESRIVEVNERFAQIVGYTTEALIGRTTLELTYPDDLANDRSHLEKLFSGETPTFVIEKRMLRQDGRIVWVRNSVSALRDPSGKVTDLIRIIEDITEARESRERLVALADSMPQIVWTAEPNGLLDYFNHVWYEYSGTTLAENVGTGWARCVHPDDLAVTAEKWSRSLATGEDYRNEFRLRRADGVYRWHLVRARPARDVTGSIQKWYGTNTDIHDERELTNALERSSFRLESEQAKFETLFADSSTSLALLQGPELVFERANPSYAALFDNRVRIGVPILACLPELIGQPFPELLTRVLDTGIPYAEREAKAFLRRTDTGVLEERYFDQTYTIVRDAFGAPYGVFIHAIEVTERVFARRALEESQERLTVAIEAAELGTWDLDPRTMDVTWSDRSAIIFGFQSAAELKLDSALHRVHPEDFPRVTAAIADALNPDGHGDYKIDYRVVRPNGSIRWLSLLGQAYFEIGDDGGRKVRRFSGAMIDVTDRVIAQLRLVESREAAEAANRAKSAFLANMSHEIRTPLGAIMGFLSLLRDPKIAPADNDRYLSIIDRNSHQLLRIIDDVLDLSKVEAGKLDVERIEFSLPELLADFASLMGLRARSKGVRFEVEALTPIPNLVVSDPTRVRQILANVVGNAIKFTAHGTVTLSVSVTGKRLSFRVRDTGIGISSEQRTRLFQPFAQAESATTRTFGGTGLGLVLTRRLSELLGGHFNLTESEQGVGSVFEAVVEVEVPERARWIDDPGALFRTATERSSSTTDIRLDGLSVLVVEDSPDNQTLLLKILEGAGARVRVEGDGDAGLRAALADPYDAIVLDIQMPRLDGHEVVRLLRAREFRGPVIALTAHAMKEERERALDSGFDHFLAKPIDRASLLRTISELRASVSPAVSTPHAKQSILVIEDDADTRDLLDDFLTGEGHSVQTASDGETALRILRSAGANFPRLLLVDLTLPDLSGKDLIGMINALPERSQVKILLASGRGDIAVIGTALSVDGSLQKPYKLDDLLAEIDRVSRLT